MVYSLRGIEQYLKSHFGEIGRFSCILGFFPDFHDFVVAKRGAGPIESTWKFHISDTRGRFSIFMNIQIDLINLILIN